MAGVTGKTAGVGKDIIDYLQAVGEAFDCTINVTSGLRDADAQASAMFNNWIKLKRGAAYKKTALSEQMRKKLDEYYVTAKEDKKADAKAKKRAEADFLNLASEVKSKHNKGRAVDIATSSVNAKVLKVILLEMTEVKEDDRTDIYHVESDAKIAAPTDKDKEKWGAPKKDKKK